MNRHIKQIQIKNACHEDWGNMTDVSGGKYCMNCQKNVVDFSKMTNQEILDYISKADKLCGRFNNGQLDNLNLQLALNKKATIFQKWSFAALLTALIPFVNTEAKAKPVYEQHDNSIKNTANLTDSTHTFKVTGTISDNGVAVPYVQVQVKGTTIQTLTNNSGFFQINVPSTADTLIISTIGYNTQKINVSAVRLTPLDIYLNRNNALHPEEIFSRTLGGVYIVRRSFLYRTWYTIKRPFRAIFHS